MKMGCVKSQSRSKNGKFEAKPNGHLNKSERSMNLGDRGRRFKLISVCKIETFEIDGLQSISLTVYTL